MLWHCLTCTARYAASLLTCPQCGSAERRAAHEVDEEDAVGKISRWAGASHGGPGAAQEAAAGVPDGGTLPAPGEDISEDEAATGIVQEPGPGAPEAAAETPAEPAPVAEPESAPVKPAPTLARPKKPDAGD
jgi:hypothetical protein